MIDRPRKWQRIIGSLNYERLPFNLIRSFTIKLEDGSEYIGSSQEDFRNIFISLKNDSTNLFLKFTIIYEPNYLKIKKEVQKCVEPLLKILSGD